ncbi:MAG: ClpXP protease specificity-enhancing factor SspB [Defluviicoccus sp.]|nr:ClpXP protease specificity-enhancing factor SspB [Defluviicoccus sp.]MDE0277466.1 ClpXP protease specificity-enhancing factor SspB [Defluviicoccus sp.]
MSKTEESLVPYQDMMERALRGVMRDALALAGEQGLPGNHHYYISFLTQHDGVTVPDNLRARYPDEMTIVLQHQFWGLETEEDGFSVTLSFGGKSERLTVPFEAVTAFVDPAVDFGLRFGPGPEEDTDDAADGAEDAETDTASVVSLDRFRKT